MAEGDGSDPVNGAQTPASEAKSALNPAGAVFISYASLDKAAADSVCAGLERGGITCWIAPRDVTPGVFYADAIVQAINAAQVLIVVLSVNSVGSQHVLREVERASAKRRPLVAFRLDTTPLPTGLEYFLSASHWLDASGGTTERALPELVTAVHRLLSAPEMPHAAGGLHGNVSVKPSNGGTDVRESTPKSRQKRIWVATVASILLLALLFGIFWLSNHSSRQSATAPVMAAAPAAVSSTPTILEKSIAVLPFADLSEKKDQEYFADGIAEEVLDRLAKVPGLKVVGHASSFQFKDKSAVPANIGAALGVSYLLEGSVRREGGHIRVTAQLVDARTGSQKWSDHFDSDVVDVLQMQDNIAVELARALQIAVEADSAPHSSIKSPEAHDAYLRGLQSYNRGTRESCEAAVADFQQALTLDPTFAPAAIALANTYVFIGNEAWLPTSVAFERAREAALLAQRLDPKSPRPHISMASIHTMYDWDWAGADRELQQAFTLGPRETSGALSASWLAAARGQWDEARQFAIEAIALDPLDAEAQQSIGFEIYLRSGRLTEAEESFRRTLQISPKYGSGHYFLGEVLMLQGHYEPALAEFRKETLDDGQLEGSVMVNFAAGRRAESDAQLAEAIRRNASSWPSEFARVYAFRGEKDRAFEWLNKAYEARDEDVYFIKGDPLLKNLEGDPRYKAFLRKMNLPE